MVSTNEKQMNKDQEQATTSFYQHFRNDLRARSMPNCILGNRKGSEIRCDFIDQINRNTEEPTKYSEYGLRINFANKNVIIEHTGKQHINIHYYAENNETPRERNTGISRNNSETRSRSRSNELFLNQSRTSCNAVHKPRNVTKLSTESQNDGIDCILTQERSNSRARSRGHSRRRSRSKSRGHSRVSRRGRTRSRSREYSRCRSRGLRSYLFFWDKIERSHYWLNNIVSTAKVGEQLDGRLVNFLLKDPINDGGQWDMIVNLINKYGLMPKKCFPESYSSRRSLRMNALIKTKLREFAKELRDMVASKKSDEEIQATIKSQISIIYNIVATCLGTPAEHFIFEFYNKEKAYKNFGPLTPLQFYQKHVRPLYNVDDKVCLVSDPRESNPFGCLYTLQCLGNVVGGNTTAYNNQPIEVLMQAVKASIQDGEAVWFGCEVMKRFEGKNGLEDLDAHDYKLVFNTEVQIGLNKADRLLYGDSCMTHAMVFTAIGTDESGHPIKYRVENSYGDKEYDKGYLLLTEGWFREFVFEVVVDKKYVPPEVLEVFNQKAKVLPAWDPMGTLACPLCSKE